VTDEDGLANVAILFDRVEEKLSDSMCEILRSVMLSTSVPARRRPDGLALRNGQVLSPVRASAVTTCRLQSRGHHEPNDAAARTEYNCSHVESRALTLQAAVA
jgi:hypothetical protein